MWETGHTNGWFDGSMAWMSEQTFNSLEKLDGVGWRS